MSATTSGMTVFSYDSTASRERWAALMILFPTCGRATLTSYHHVRRGSAVVAIFDEAWPGGTPMFFRQPQSPDTDALHTSGARFDFFDLHMSSGSSSASRSSPCVTATRCGGSAVPPGWRRSSTQEHDDGPSCGPGQGRRHPARPSRCARPHHDVHGAPARRGRRQLSAGRGS